MSNRLPKKRKRAKARNGRPPKITEEVAQKIAEWVAKGMPHRLAAIHCGVSPESWDDAKDNRPTIKLICEKAQAGFIGHAIEVMEASPKGHAGIAFLLERRQRELFGRQPIIENHSHQTLMISEKDMLAFQEVGRRIAAPVVQIPINHA